MKCPQCGKEMEHIGPVIWECECGCEACMNKPQKKHEPMTEECVLERTIIDNGPTYETMVAIEEMSELTKELVKDFRDMGDLEHIAEEMADVEICMAMLKMIYCNAEMVEEWKIKKLRRLEERLYSDD